MKVLKSLILGGAIFFASSTNAQIYIDSDDAGNNEEVKEITEEKTTAAPVPAQSAVAPAKVSTPATKAATPSAKTSAPAVKKATPATKTAAPAPKAETMPAKTKPDPVKTTTEDIQVENNESDAAMGEELPSWAKPGRCYARCMVPDQYEFREEKVVDKPSSVRTQTIPAEYETVFDTIVTKPASTRIEKIPAEYETITEEIMVAPASTKWVKGKGNQNCLSANPEDCQVMCLVEVPATYKTVTKRVLKSPEYEQEITTPAEFKFVTKRVMRTPERVVEMEVPATYKTIMRKVLIKKGELQGWKEVLCNDKLTTEKIVEIQKALKARGYDPGPIDDVLGAQTRAALIKYQRDKNLPVGNLNFETLKSLGVE